MTSFNDEIDGPDEQGVKGWTLRNHKHATKFIHMDATDRIAEQEGAAMTRQSQNGQLMNFSQKAKLARSGRSF